MTEVVVFPDVEAVLVEALPALLDVPVSTRVPNPRPDAFVRVTRVGGSRRDRITDRALVVVEAWASTTGDAFDLGALARGQIEALTEAQHGPLRGYEEVGGLQAFPDPDTETPRYQLTALLDLRGAAL
jgi:hypothetical protein